LVDMATSFAGDKQPSLEEQEKDLAAVTRGRARGFKGGNARVEKLGPEEPAGFGTEGRTSSLESPFASEPPAVFDLNVRFRLSLRQDNSNALAMLAALRHV
jgi:hypothetical protein